MATYGGSAVWSSTFDLVTDGVKRFAASVNVALEALADRTVYLYNHRLTMLGEQIISDYNKYTRTTDWSDTNIEFYLDNLEDGDVLTFWVCCGIRVSGTSSSSLEYTTYRVMTTDSSKHYHCERVISAMMSQGLEVPVSFHGQQTLSQPNHGGTPGRAKIQLQYRNSSDSMSTSPQTASLLVAIEKRAP